MQFIHLLGLLIIIVNKIQLIYVQVIREIISVGLCLFVFSNVLHQYHHRIFHIHSGHLNVLIVFHVFGIKLLNSFPNGNYLEVSLYNIVGNLPMENLPLSKVWCFGNDAESKNVWTVGCPTQVYTVWPNRSEHDPVEEDLIFQGHIRFLSTN